MSRQKVLPQQEWFEAHKAHLEREKELTHLRETIAAERRQLPWLRIRKDYVFETERGPEHLADLFKGKSQLIVYHFMFPPNADYRCEGCSFLADHIDGADQHLRHNDVSLVVVSRAPLDELRPYKQRMGWTFDWASSYASDFNFDMQVSFTDKQIAAGETVYNFEKRPLTSKDLPGASVFMLGEDGSIYLTFTTRARGGEPLITTYDYLDMTPKGRREDERRMMTWVKLHDEYDAENVGRENCCH